MRPPRLPGLGQLPGDLEPLGLAAGERGGRLAQPEVAQPHLLQVPQGLAQRGLVSEAADRLVDGELQHIGDGVAVDLHLQDLAPVAGTAAGLAGDVHVGQKDHLDQHRARPLRRSRSGRRAC